MSKKQLNEVRRFMKLANLNGNITSNFVKRLSEDGALYDREDDLEADEEGIEDLEGDMADDELDMAADEEGIEDLEADEGGDAEELVLSIVSDIQQLASLAGVDVDVEGGDVGGEEELGGMEAEIDIEEPDGMEAEIDIEGEETLEEMIDAILQDEEDEEEDLEESLRDWAKKASKKLPWNVKGSSADDQAELDRLDTVAHGGEVDVDDMLDPTDDPGSRFGGSAKTKRRAKRPSRGQQPPVGGVTKTHESIQVLDDNKLIKEVSKRVKERLTKIARARSKKRRQ